MYYIFHSVYKMFALEMNIFGAANVCSFAPSLVSTFLSLSLSHTLSIICSFTLVPTFIWIQYVNTRLHETLSWNEGKKGGRGQNQKVDVRVIHGNLIFSLSIIILHFFYITLLFKNKMIFSKVEKKSLTLKKKNISQMSCLHKSRLTLIS